MFWRVDSPCVGDALPRSDRLEVRLFEQPLLKLEPLGVGDDPKLVDDRYLGNGHGDVQQCSLLYLQMFIHAHFIPCSCMIHNKHKFSRVQTI